MIRKIRSIRRFLLISLFSALILTSLITTIGNFYLDYIDIEKHLDSLLKHVTQSFQLLLSNQLIIHNIPRLQGPIDNYMAHLSANRQLLFEHKHIPSRYEFQVWSLDGKLLLHSVNAPQVPLSNVKDGFSTITINDEIWRAYTQTNGPSQLKFIVAEKQTIRKILIKSLVNDDFYILLIIYPIAGLLIWIIVGYALAGIERVTEEVRHRLPNYLAPVDAAYVPNEIKPLVTELNKLFVRLHQAFEREKRFAADAAHELKTPLAALKTQAQVGINSKSDAERIEILHNIVTASDRLTHIVQQLLTMSRLIAQADLQQENSQIDLSKVASEVIAMLVPFALGKNIDIELIAPEGALVWGNVAGISILLRNLVDNAIRYSPDYGNIQVIIHNHANHIELQVIDSGPGIPESLQSRVFERFYRVVGNQKPGSGLGLSIVKQIADLHHAEIQLKTPACGHGLAVFIKFPRL